VVLAVDGAAMHPAGAVVTRVVSHWTQGAIAGAVTGLGVSTTQEDRLGPAITLAAIATGAIAGAFLRREVPVFRGLRLPHAGWRLVAVEPEASGPRFGAGPGLTAAPTQSGVSSASSGTSACCGAGTA